MFIGAIADDLTGATDLSLMLARSGMRVIQIAGIPESTADFGDAEAVVVALKSRTIPAAEAVAQSLAAARILLQAGAAQFFFKYCSTFDSTDEGNIGPVTEALMALLDVPFTIACPAFPANGRRVYRGHLFVGDQLLSDSSMKDHPLTPMRDANLVRVLQRQIAQPVSLIAQEVVAGPAAGLEARFAEGCGIAIVDAISDDDLMRIGHAARGLRLVTGGSGVALGLPANHLPPDRAPGAPPLPVPAGRAVVLAGSCSAATRGQVAVAIAAGMPALRLDAMEIAAGRMSVTQARDFVLAQSDPLPPLVYSSADPAIIAQVQDALGRDRAGGLVEHFLAELAESLAAQGFNRFLVAGGETSGAVVAGLGVRRLEIGAEIDPGVPWTRAHGRGGPLALALKSGNFGAEDFFLKAWRLLP